MIRRYLAPFIAKDLPKKLVLLSGPRQVGKTTLAKSYGGYYLNYDVLSDRRIIQFQSWDKSVPLVILDELHKLHRWKAWLKGVWDGRASQQFLVTGSARLDIFRRGGESLAGRFFHHQLHPFTVGELRESDPQSTLVRLIQRGGFPEPYLASTDEEAARWRLSHVDRIIRDDLPSISSTTGIRQIELLIDLLSERVGSTVSYANLAGDLSVSPPTVKQWIELLEMLCVIFLVRPYARASARSIRKEPKVYFFDTGRVADIGDARFENAIACHLLKRNHFLSSTRGERRALYYVRDKEGREVDFLTEINRSLEFLIETKSSDADLSRGLSYYASRLKARPLQLVLAPIKRQQRGAAIITSAGEWLSTLEC